MAETTLKVKVNDDVFISDDLNEIIEVIVESFKKWHDSSEEAEFSFRVEKVNNNSPPTLEIKVEETIKTKAAFG